MIYKEFCANSSPLNIASIERKLQNVFVRRMFVMSNDYDNSGMITAGVVLFSNTKEEERHSRNKPRIRSNPVNFSKNAQYSLRKSDR